jgi:hypothetical protein
MRLLDHAITLRHRLQTGYRQYRMSRRRQEAPANFGASRPGGLCALITIMDDKMQVMVPRNRVIGEDEVPRYKCSCSITTCPLFYARIRCLRKDCPQKYGRHSDIELAICGARAIDDSQPLQLYCSEEKESKSINVLPLDPTKWRKMHSTTLWLTCPKSRSFEKIDHVTLALSCRAHVGRRVCDQREAGSALACVCENVRLFLSTCVRCVCVCVLCSWIARLSPTKAVG